MNRSHRRCCENVCVCARAHVCLTLSSRMGWDEVEWIEKGPLRLRIISRLAQWRRRLKMRGGGGGSSIDRTNASFWNQPRFISIKRLVSEVFPSSCCLIGKKGVTKRMLIYWPPSSYLSLDSPTFQFSWHWEPMSDQAQVQVRPGWYLLGENIAYLRRRRRRLKGSKIDYCINEAVYKSYLFKSILLPTYTQTQRPKIGMKVNELLHDATHLG